MSPKANDTLMAMAIRNVGMRKAFKAMLYLAQWGIAYEAEGPMTPEQLSEWWKESRATSFGNQAKFREAFPGEQTPERLWTVAQVERATRRNQKEVLAQLTSAPWSPPEGRLL